MIEFALGMLVLAPVLVGLVRWSVTSYLVYEMQEGVRRGAAYAATQPTAAQPLSAGKGSPLESRVRNVVLFGRPEQAGTPMIPGLRPENVQVIYSEASGRRTVAVAIAEYDAPGGLFRLSPGPRAQLPYLGRAYLGLPADPARQPAIR